MSEQSRAELFAQEVLGRDRDSIKAKLRERKAVVGISRVAAASRQGQIGLVTAVNILARLGELAPNLFLDVPGEVRVLPGVPLLTVGRPLGKSLLSFMQRLAGFQEISATRSPADRSLRYECGLFIGDATLEVDNPITIGARGWLATVNVEKVAEPVGGNDPNPLGIILAAALGSAEIVKHLWLPIQDPQGGIEPMRRRTTLSAFDWSVDPTQPFTPPMPRRCQLGHVCVFGLGATGSACNYILGCLPGLEMSLDLVDSDRISPSNEERLFTSADPRANANLPKVYHAAQFIRSLHSDVRPFVYTTRFERYVETARDRLGYVWCCLDSGPPRRTLQTELASVVVNSGTDLSRWMVSVHEFERPENACLRDLYPAPRAQGFRPEEELARHLGIPVGVIRRIARDGRPLDPALIASAIQNQKDMASRTAIARYAGKRFDQAVLQMCSEMRPNPALPAATISFVSVIPAIFMVADLIKRRLYGWHLPKGQPNVLQCDALRRPDQGTICNVLAAPGCYCQSPRHSEAFRKRQRLRKRYLGVSFPYPAPEGPP